MNIEIETVKKLQNINNVLNLIEVHGLTNVYYLYTSLVEIQKVLQDIEKDNRGVVIDNTMEVNA